MSHPHKSANKRFWVAILIISPAFVLIALMLSMQFLSTSAFTDKVATVVKNPDFKPEQIDAVTKTFAEMDRSNLTVFNILLPVFAAWVGAVVAFYFGSENLSNAQKSFEKTQDTLSTALASGSSPDITIEKLLVRYPSAKKPITTTLDNVLQDVEGDIKKFDDVIVNDAQGNPLGVLYRADLFEPNEWNGQTKLRDYITKVTDHITQKKWSENGVKNYATLSLQDKISDTKHKMDEIKPNSPEIRGIVFDNGKMIAIVDSDMLQRP